MHHLKSPLYPGVWQVKAETDMYLRQLEMEGRVEEVRAGRG